MKRILIALTLTFSTGLVYAQQDAQQSQYMFNGIYINPAYAGYQENLNLHGYFRSQWTGLSGSPISGAAAIDAIANDGNVGLAAQIAYDKLGAQTNMLGYLNYAYRIRMNEDGSSRLALGIGFGGVQYSLDGSKLNPNDPEPNQPTGTISKILPDARVGVYFSNNQLYAGLSADNLISQLIDVKASNSYLPQPSAHIYLTAGCLLPLTEFLQLKPSFLIKDDRAGPTSLDLNSFLILSEKLWVGASYRTAVHLYAKNYLQSNLTPLNSVVVAVQFFANENLRIGYAYDLNVGPLAGYNAGSHELSIGFALPHKQNRMLSPRFF